MYVYLIPVLRCCINDSFAHDFFLCCFLSECCSRHSMFLNIVGEFWMELFFIVTGRRMYCHLFCFSSHPNFFWRILIITSFLLNWYDIHWYPYLNHGFSAFRMSRQVFLSTRPCLLGFLDPTNSFGGDVKIQCLKRDKITKAENAKFSSSLSHIQTHTHMYTTSHVISYLCYWYIK